MAGTSLDKHHALLDDLTIRTSELHRESGCSVWGATTPIGADTTKFGSVGLHTGTARQLKFDRLRDLGCTNAFFTFLDALLKVCFARSHHAKSALFLQPAVGIVVGDPGRDSHSTGF